MIIDWGSIETDCWSRDFDYKEYVVYFRKANIHSTPVGEKEYNDLCKLCDMTYYDYLEV